MAARHHRHAGHVLLRRADAQSWHRRPEKPHAQRGFAAVARHDHRVRLQSAGVRGVVDFPRGVTQSVFRFRKHGRRAIACDFADRATPHGKESIGRRYSDRTIARKARNTISRNARNTAKHGYAYPGQHHI